MVITLLTVEDVRPHDAMSPQTATVATALTLVSCSGIRQICHGNRETEQEKHSGERWADGGMEMMKSCFWDTAHWDF